MNRSLFSDHMSNHVIKWSRTQQHVNNGILCVRLRTYFLYSSLHETVQIIIQILFFLKRLTSLKNDAWAKVMTWHLSVADHFQVMRKWCKKMEIEIFDKWLISLDLFLFKQIWFGSWDSAGEDLYDISSYKKHFIYIFL